MAHKGYTLSVWGFDRRIDDEKEIDLRFDWLAPLLQAGRYLIQASEDSVERVTVVSWEDDSRMLGQMGTTLYTFEYDDEPTLICKRSENGAETVWVDLDAMIAEAEEIDRRMMAAVS